MKILGFGSGGREHALARSLNENNDVLWAPGNPGIAADGIPCISVRVDDIPELVVLARREQPDLVVVGPEQPYADGIVDAFADTGIPIVGPTAAAAQLEASKVFTHELCLGAGVPIPMGYVPHDLEDALSHVAQHGPMVAKADGLAAGKGVLMSDTVDEAQAALRRMMQDREFGDAGARVLLQQRMRGTELSVFALTDGTDVAIIGTAQDYKRQLDGGKGPNTGGMGSISPSPLMTPELEHQVLEEILKPTVSAMQARVPGGYRGVLYAGLMLTDKGLVLIEYNIRFGDPETQALSLPSNLAELLLATTQDGVLKGLPVEIPDQKSVCVVLAREGYPGSGRTGDVIEGISDAELVTDVFHAGTKRLVPAGNIVTNGGRVLDVVGHGSTFDVARGLAYEGVSRISWPDMQYREDIGAGYQ